MKAGTSECVGCNHRFDKPDMREISWSESSGYSVGIFGGILGNNKGKGGSVRQYFRKKKGWLCDECHAGRKSMILSFALMVVGGLFGLHSFYGGRFLKGILYLVLAFLGIEFIAILLGDLYFGLVNDPTVFASLINSSAGLVEEPWRFVAFGGACFMLFLDFIEHVSLKISDRNGLPYKFV